GETSSRFQFRFIGPVAPEAASVRRSLSAQAELFPKRPQRELPQEYTWGDLFVFPTVEDGFAVVLAQANAAGLPILTSANCSGPDLVREGETGWILPIRAPKDFIDRLLWCDSHRQELADMVTTTYLDFKTRDWANVAADFEAMCQEEMAERRPAIAGN